MEKENQILSLIQQETQRQKETIRLIASENYVSKPILEALGSSLTNKYSEGYPDKRYYEGQEFIDQIEKITIQRAKQLFKAQYANVQAYSGSPANLGVYFSLIKPGDTIMGLSLSHGGHLTHGHKVSITGSWFNSVSYEVNPDSHYIDYDKLEKLAQQHKPTLIISGHSAYPRQVDFKRIGEIARSVGAYHLADIAHISGLVAIGLHQSPLDHADVVTLTTHKMLRGPRGALILTNNSEIAQKIDKAIFPGLQGGPHMNNIAGIGIALEEALSPKYTEYTNQILKNTKALILALQKYDFDFFTNGSDNHIALIDLRNKKITGSQASKALIQANIETNKNTIPFDPASPFNPNGLRLGTPAVTTLGLKEVDMTQIALFIHQAIMNHNQPQKLLEIQQQVKQFITHFSKNSAFI